MRLFNTIYWSDHKIEKLDYLGKYLYIYLITNEHTNWSGCYEISYKKIMYESDFPSLTQLKESFKALIDNRFISYNEETNEVLLFNWYKSNWNNSPKIDSVIYKDILKIKTREYAEYVYDLFLKRDSVSFEKERYPIDTLSIPYRYPIDTPIYNNNINNNNITNVIIEEESNYKEEIKNKEENDKKEEETENIYEERFEIFWRGYPRKEGKGKCREWFIKHKVNAELLEIMISSVERQKASEKWNEERGRYIPMPYTWLNQSRWEDDLIVNINCSEDNEYNSIDIEELRKRLKGQEKEDKEEIDLEELRKELQGE